MQNEPRRVSEHKDFQEAEEELDEGEERELSEAHSVRQNMNQSIVKEETTDKASKKEVKCFKDTESAKKYFKKVQGYYLEQFMG